MSEEFLSAWAREIGLGYRHAVTVKELLQVAGVKDSIERVFGPVDGLSLGAFLRDWRRAQARGDGAGLQLHVEARAGSRGRWWLMDEVARTEHATTLEKVDALEARVARLEQQMEHDQIMRISPNNKRRAEVQAMLDAAIRRNMSAENIARLRALMPPAEPL